MTCWYDDYFNGRDLIKYNVLFPLELKQKKLKRSSVKHPGTEREIDVNAVDINVFHDLVYKRIINEMVVSPDILYAVVISLVPANMRSAKNCNAISRFIAECYANPGVKPRRPKKNNGN